MSPKFAQTSDDAIQIHVIEEHALQAWLKDAPPQAVTWVNSTEFKAKLGSTALIPNADGGLDQVLFGWGTEAARQRGRFHFGALAGKLPAGTYTLASGLSGQDLVEAALGWLLEGYRFHRYVSGKPPRAALVAPDGLDAARLEYIAAGAFTAQDLINTPTNDMGPEQLHAAFEALAARFGASASAITGDALLSQNLPMIHTVGRASDQLPRLLDMRWGDPKAPQVTLVGKGVCFDTGGLNIKPAGSMGLMKKDMGGAANAMGLAEMIMAAELPISLRLLVPAVENSISAGAFRPQDILTSRKGLSVEINNTDAEGRLVLADALALGDEEKPDLMISLATLTGAARVALGPDVMPYFTDDDALAADLETGARASADPLWRMPFWSPYEKMIEPGVADLDNAPKGGFAGAITAALFLRRFVEHADAYAHFDIYGWTPTALPGRPKGGACQASRAIFAMLAARYS